MPYEEALEKGWEALEKAAETDVYTVPLLGDTYELNIGRRSSFSNSCNTPTKDYVTILLLHYLIGMSKKRFRPSGEWISFKDIEGGATYYPAYRSSVIKPLLKKYGSRPSDLLNVTERFKTRRIEAGDAAIELETFPDVWVRVILWSPDSEFGPEASILYDRNITQLYTMEDVTVFSQFIVHNL